MIQLRVVWKRNRIKNTCKTVNRNLPCKYLLQCTSNWYFVLVFQAASNGVRQGGRNIRHPALWEGRAIRPGSIINSGRCRITVKFLEANVLRVIVTVPKIPVEEGTCKVPGKAEFVLTEKRHT